MFERGLRASRSALDVALLIVRKLGGPGVGRWWRRLCGAALVAFFLTLLAALWHPVYRFTGLLQVDRSNEARALPVVREQPVALNDDGYDGQYYGQLACDPTLRTPELRTAIDSLSYRARRILLPAAAWGLGCGRSAWVIQVYPWLNIGCWLALAWLLWPLLQADGRWLGVAAWAGVLFSAGALASVRYSLTDLPSLLLFVLAMRAAGAERPGRMAAWFAASLLARETMLVGAWGLCRKGWDRPAGWGRSVGWLAAAVIPLAAWLAYVRWMVGANGAGQRNFQWPGIGLVNRWREVLAALGTNDDRLLAWASLLATAALAVQLVFLLTFWEWRNRWWRVGVGFAALALVLGDAVWEGFPGASPRVLLPLLLVCSVLALQRRWAPVWLLCLSLSVPMGLLEMTPWPDERELAAQRSGGTAVVLRAAEGCHGPERLKQSRWVWAAQEAQWRLRVWGASAGAQATLTAKVRALDERELVIEWSGGELWRGRVGTNWTPVRLAPFAVSEGWVTLTLRSPQAPVREGPGADARLFSVCLLDPKVELRSRASGDGN